MSCLKKALPATHSANKAGYIQKTSLFII